jgi:sulfatase modifying factor 1
MDWQPAYANLRDSGRGSVTPVDPTRTDYPRRPARRGWKRLGMDQQHDYGGAVLSGGSSTAPPLYARCTFLNAAPTELRSSGIGLRVMREL